MELPESVEVTLVGQPYSGLAISPNNQTVIAISGATCQILSESKTDQRRVLTHDSEVIGAFFQSDDHLVTVTESGEVCEFEAQEKAFEKLVSRRVTAFPVVCAFAHKQEEKELELWLVVRKNEAKKKNNTYDVCVTGANGSLEKVLEIPGNLRKEQICIADRVISYCDGLEVHSIVLKDEDRSVQMRTKHVAKATEDGDFKHHFERLYANGNHLVAAISDGRILEWSRIKTSGVSDTHHRIHWHKVGAHVAVTQFGSIVSAGAECVLARHSKGNGGQPTLLPRLAAPITGLVLSQDSSTCGLIMEDNSVHTVLLSTMAIKSTFSILEHCPRSLNSVFTSDPLHSKHIVMNGKPGTIQWIDPFTVSTWSKLHVTLENVIDGDMTSRGIRSTFRDVLTCSLTQDFIVSIEKFVNFDGENHVRFWQRVPKPQQDRLIASVTAPRDTVFLATCSAPESRYKNTIITATTSGTISVWDYTEKDVREDVERSRNWQEAEIRAVSRIQADGKFASAHGPNAVLWSVKNMKIIDVLTCDDDIKTLDFSADHRYLIISTKRGVVCWDTLCLLVVWRIQQSVGICVSPHGCFAFDGPQVMEFEPETGRVLNTVQFSAFVYDLQVVAQRYQALVFVAKTAKGLLCHRPSRISRSGKGAALVAAPDTPFHQLARIPSTTSSSATSSADQQFVQQPRPEAARLFAGPVHQLPPISFIAPLFIEKSLLPPPVRI